MCLFLCPLSMGDHSKSYETQSTQKGTKPALDAALSITEAYALILLFQLNPYSGSAYRGSNPWGAAKSFQQFTTAYAASISPLLKSLGTAWTPAKNDRADCLRMP